MTANDSRWLRRAAAPTYLTAARVSPSVLVDLIRWLMSDASDGITGYRITANRWNSDVSPTRTCATPPSSPVGVARSREVDMTARSRAAFLAGAALALAAPRAVRAQESTTVRVGCVRPTGSPRRGTRRRWDFSSGPD